VTWTPVAGAPPSDTRVCGQIASLEPGHYEVVVSYRGVEALAVSPLVVRPHKPALEGVIRRKGPPAEYVPRKILDEYEVLPSSTVRLRLRDQCLVGLSHVQVWVDGVAAREVSQAGPGGADPYFFIEWDAKIFDLIVILPQAKQGGPRATIEVRLKHTPDSPNTERSDPLVLSAVAHKSRVEPSDVFFHPPDGTNIAGGWVFLWNSKDPTNVVARDIVISGWLFAPPAANDPGLGIGIEDIHYHILVDPDSVLPYRGGGLDYLLNEDAVFPGAVPYPLMLRIPLPVHDFAVGGVRLGVTMNTFVLPGNIVSHDFGQGGERFGLVVCEPELNSWHIQKTDRGGFWADFYKNYMGRGPPPAGWTRWEFGAPHDDWFPYGPMNPEGQQLAKGDYVRMKGTLYQDHSHGDKEGPPPDLRRWERRIPGQGGWLEIHPVDWIQVLPKPPLNRRKTAVAVAIATEGDARLARGKLFPGGLEYPGGERSDHAAFTWNDQMRVRSVEELIDGRFSAPGGGQGLLTSPNGASVRFLPRGDHVEFGLQVPPNSGFKAVYVVSWDT